MKKNIIYRLNINENIYIEILYDGNELILVSNGNAPKNTISLVSTGKKSIIKVAGIPKCTIDLKNGIVRTNLKYIPSSTIRNFSECINTEGKDIDFISNYVYYKRKVNDKVTHNETELHTHFMEVLTGEDFLNIALNHLEYIGVDRDGNLCRAYPTDDVNPKELDYSGISEWFTKDDILSYSNIYNNFVEQLSLPIDKQVDFSEINKILLRRTALLDLIGFHKIKNIIDYLDVPENQLENAVRKLRSDAKADIYVEILIKSLETLKKQGIKYVELSYSTPSTIVKICDKMKNINIEGIKYSFLLSENRNAEGKSFREYYTEGDSIIPKRNKKAVEVILPKLIKAGYVTGFDLMGMEQEITLNDYEKNSFGNSSLYDKLTPIIKVLNSFNDKNIICRLHAGEMQYPLPNFDGKSNPERILEILDKIVDNNNLIIPPPSIRLGHGIHIEKTNNYLNLLKKYKVIIEINSSSNFALGNIKNMKDIPYRWYYENNIPMVLGTDGGGFYLSTPIDESQNAEIFGGKDVIDNIKITDYLEKKRRGL